MPAQRSRTQNWRRCLTQLHERGGSVEIAVSDPGDEASDAPPHRHLVWRVRVLDLSETEIVVEQPVALGRTVALASGVGLIAVLAVGQNRWMFRTEVLGDLEYRINEYKRVAAIRIRMPDRVERCQRRSYYRVQTAALVLPEVEIWPLLDPKSVVIAERANELAYENGEQIGGDAADAPRRESETLELPEVGPKFIGDLVNIGGGGVGMRIEPDQARPIQSHKVFWMRFGLPPELLTPICVTCKLVHSHLESSQHIYAGMAFDFTFNPSHERFVVDQICRYIALQQRGQLRRGREGAAA